jgi:hypothetical protein
LFLRSCEPFFFVVSSKGPDRTVPLTTVR